VKVPATPEVIKSLPRAPYRRNRPGPDGQPRSSPAPERCPICQMEYEEGDPTVTLPRCGHCLHEECGVQWLGEHSKKCPLCKASVMEDE
jgi:hypothetical protein